MNKELKDYTTEELEARFDHLFEMSDMKLAELDMSDSWNNWVAIDLELGDRK